MTKRTPKYCHHKPIGQARVCIQGKDFRREADRVVQYWQQQTAEARRKQADEESRPPEGRWLCGFARNEVRGRPRTTNE